MARSTHHPLVSLIIPAYNEETLILRALEQVSRLVESARLDDPLIVDTKLNYYRRPDGCWRRLISQELVCNINDEWRGNDENGDQY